MQKKPEEKIAPYMRRTFLPDIAALDKKDFSTDHITLSMLQEAYWHGYFPWPEDSASEKIPWVHPKFRGLLPLPCFHIPHTVKRLLKKGPFELRIDTAFEEVLHQCAHRNDGEETWITPEIHRAYLEFHEAGWAHSFEAWNRETGTLAGGLYGVSIGGIFAGESMFYRESGASKFALACLGQVLSECGAFLIDTQMVTPVTEQFGANYYYREEYLEILPELRGEPLSTEQLRVSADRLKELGKLP